tara:strand:- start:833 stop:1378 length:546 start_codon:yes stop_codon:yes gene_type:complete
MLFKVVKATDNPFLRVVTEYLQGLNFPKKITGKKSNNYISRQNISSEKNKIVEAFVLGKVRVFHQRENMDSSLTKKYEEFFELLAHFVYYQFPDFEWTSIQINKNVTCDWHLDKGNEGESLCLAVGDFDGGGIELMGEHGPMCIDNRNKFLQYDGGNIKHRSIPHKNGDRYAIIFYTCKQR